ncbi:DUF4091 domain-containing protein [Chitinophaga niabensis]|uniref:DUF4091 domain-containing protein n=1 Tax=Chitinophaga niabensis TaxID=536979 RepID=UPI0031BA8278
MKKVIILLLLSAGFFTAQAQSMNVWLETSLKRIFPQSPAGTDSVLELSAARGSRISFQAAFHSDLKDQVHIECSMENAAELKPRIRYVGLVPMHHFTTDVRKEEMDGIGFLPGLVPEPLYPLTKVEANPYASRSFWVTLNIPANITPGMHTYNVKLKWNKGERVLKLKVNVSKLVLQPRRNFPVTHWWRGEATSIYYKTKMFDEQWWKHTEAQMRNLMEHGTDVAFVQNFFEFKTLFKQPCQMLLVDEPSPGKYTFDWSVIKRFTDMCKQMGYRKFEWAHLWMYWGVTTAMRVYTVKDGKYVLLWDADLPAFSDKYISFLKQFLPAFHAFLQKENILEDSYFHLSDEPWSEHVPNYKRARQVLKDLAPWMKVMDALSDIRYGKEHLTDIPVPIISSAAAYLKEKIPHWVYFCTGPRDKWLNRFFDTPLPKIRMSGWLFYHLKAEGFLHWGYNYWHKLDSEEASDPYTNGSAHAYPGIPDGDPFVVYPGPEGPYDSIRWEVFAESLQDYAILQSAGIDPDDKLFTPLLSYEDFPKTSAWITAALKQVLF